MAQRNMAYDHPAYLAPVAYSGAARAAASQNVSFLAHADMIAKALRIKNTVVGTSADETLNIYRVSTGNTTSALGTLVFVMTGANALNTSSYLLLTGLNTLSAGDELRVTFGTDATRQAALVFEGVVVPGASFTV